MATFCLTKKALFNISKSLPKQHCVQSCSSRACFSTSFERAQDSRNRLPTDAGRREEQRKDPGDAKIDNMSGVTGFVADTARQGVAEDLVDLAKDSTDIAWDSTKKTTQKVSETCVAEADENVVDTSEYRSIEDSNRFADQDNEHKHHQYF